MGAGKSVVAGRFAAHGARVVTADDVARELVRPGTRTYERVVEAFGEGVVGPEGALDRREVARRAFASPEATERLDRIVHPPLVEALLGELPRGDGIVVVDAALLAEWNVLDAFDVIVVVTAPLEERLDRLERAGYDRADAGKRIAAQADPEVVAGRADIVIRNDGTLTQLEERADDAWRRLLTIAGEAE
jgi:dephospho-CoA kinase